MVFVSGMTPTPGVPAPSVTGTTNFGQFASMYGGGVPSAGLGVGASPLMPSQPLLYMGAFYPKADPVGYGDDIMDWALKGDRPEKQDKIGTLSDGIRKFDSMSYTEQRNMLRLLAIGGFAGSVLMEDIDEAVQEASQPDARSAYMSLLEAASDYYMETGAKVTPEDVLRSAIAYRLGGMGINWDGKFNSFDGGIPKSYLNAAAGAGEEPLEPFSTTTTSTSKSVDLMNPKDAKGLTRAMLQQELGRDPTQAEYEDFLSALHAAERANPSTTRTTTTSNYGVNDAGQHFLEGSSTNTMTREGIGAEGLAQVAYEQAQSNPDWAEWQAVGTYFPALLSALGATVPGA